MGTDPRIRAVIGEGVTGQQLADHDWMMHGITGVLDTATPGNPGTGNNS